VFDQVVLIAFLQLVTKPANRHWQASLNRDSGTTAAILIDARHAMDRAAMVVADLAQSLV